MDSALHLSRFHSEDFSLNQLVWDLQGILIRYIHVLNINKVYTCIKFSQVFPKQS